jgi:anti-sigma B factor antagonist
MSQKIAIEHHSSAGVEIVKVKGFMDLLQVMHFEAYLDQLIQTNCIKIVLDFSELDYISSAGLGAIIGRIRDVRAKSGDIKIGGCSKPVKDILEVFGFSSVFSLTKTPEEAVSKFGA